MAKKGAQYLLSSVFEPGSALRPAVRPGMGAVAAGDRVLIANDERPRIGDSLDLDAALAAQFPNDHRWDYLFAIPDCRKLIALEPHTAKDGEIREVIAKKKNAQTELRKHLHPRHQVAHWLWVSRGKNGFSKTERARKLLDQEGIEYVGTHLRSLDRD